MSLALLLDKTCTTLDEKSKLPPTHRTAFGPAASYVVDPGKIQELYHGYCTMMRKFSGKYEDRRRDMITSSGIVVRNTEFDAKEEKSEEDEKEAKRKETVPNLEEMQEGFMPLRIKFNFKYHLDARTAQEHVLVSNTMIYLIQFAIQSAISDSFEVEDHNLILPILMSSVPLNSMLEPNINQSNLTLCYHYPYVRISTRGFPQFRSRIILHLQLTNVLGSSGLTVSPIGDWDTIIETRTLDKPLTMYGSISTPDEPPLFFSCIVPLVDPCSLPNSEDKTEFQPFITDADDVFNYIQPFEHRHFRTGIFKHEAFREFDLSDLMPLALSKDYWEKVTDVKLKMSDITDDKTFVGIYNTSPGVAGPHRIVVAGSSRTSSPGVMPSKLTPTNEAYAKAVGAETDLQISDRLIKLIDTRRIRTLSGWIDVGKALYNVTQGGEEGLNLWIKYTEHAFSPAAISSDEKKFGRKLVIKFTKTEEDCTSNYYNFHNTGITIKTLAWYAKKDNPKEYAKWHDAWCVDAFNVSISRQRHFDVSLALYRKYWLEFICSSIKGKWYQYKNHRWIEIEGGYVLRKAMSTEFTKGLEQIQSHLAGRVTLRADAECEESKTDQVAIKRIGRLIENMGNRPYKTNIMAESIDQFYSDQFNNLMDSNVSLLGLHNGVMEITEDRECIFREGKPEDYVSKNTGVFYRSEYDDHYNKAKLGVGSEGKSEEKEPPLGWTKPPKDLMQGARFVEEDEKNFHPKVREVMDYLAKVFPRKYLGLRHHFLKWAASGIKGRNSDKIFPIWTGSGNNSKSMLVKLFECSFGSYFVKFPVSLVTGKATGSSSATPELSQAKNARWGAMEESESDESIRASKVKGVLGTGGDTFFTRGLYENGGKIESTFKAFLMCNRPPRVPGADKAMRIRMKLFPFLALWSLDAPESEEQQNIECHFKLDPNFERKLPGYSSAFLWILKYYHRFYIEEGLIDPEAVTTVTDTYWKENDVYFQFTEDNIDPVTGPDGKPNLSARITLSETYEVFMTWYRKSFPNIKIPDRQVFKSEMITRWGKLTQNAWHGYQISDKNSGGGGGGGMLLPSSEKKTAPVSPGRIIIGSGKESKTMSSSSSSSLIPQMPPVPQISDYAMASMMTQKFGIAPGSTPTGIGGGGGGKITNSPRIAIGGTIPVQREEYKTHPTIPTTPMLPPTPRKGNLMISY